MLSDSVTSSLRKRVKNTHETHDESDHRTGHPGYPALPGQQCSSASQVISEDADLYGALKARKRAANHYCIAFLGALESWSVNNTNLK